MRAAAAIRGASKNLSEIARGGPVPHPTSLREATFSHKWEKGALNIRNEGLVLPFRAALVDFDPIAPFEKTIPPR
jgi:hypothetical protein